MRSIGHILALLILVLALSACGEREEGVLSVTAVVEGEHTFGSDEPIAGALIVLGGETTLEKGGRVAGSVFVLGGSLQVEGTIEDDLSVLNGEISLGPSAVVQGTLREGGGTLTQSPQATIGEVVTTETELEPRLSPGWAGQSLVNRILWISLDTLGLAVLAFVFARLRPAPLARVSRTIVEQPVVSGAFGILVGVVVPSLLVMMAFTVVLIPVMLLGVLVGALVVAYGLMGCGAALGAWLRHRFEWQVSPALSAFVGTLLFMLFTHIVAIVPLIGGIIPLAFTVVGIGAVLLTRFGLYRFVPAIEVETPEPQASF